MDEEYKLMFGDTKWTIKIYPTIEEALSKSFDVKSLPGVSNYTEITGILTEDKRGLLVPNFMRNSNHGYFIIPAADFVEDKQLIGAPDYVSLSDTRNFNEILALQYFEEKCPEPKTVGFFYAEDWSENDYLKNKNTSATFRIRSVLLEEFKEICSEKDLSQTEIISDILWDFNRNFRLKTGNPYRSWKISLPDGTVWPPQSEEDF